MCFHNFARGWAITLLRFSVTPLPDNCFSSAFTHQRKSPGDKEVDKGVNARDYLAKADWIWGCSSQIDSSGRARFTADAHRSDGKRCMNPNLSRSLSPQFNICRMCKHLLTLMFGWYGSTATSQFPWENWGG
jgi:hypothetical protein